MTLQLLDLSLQLRTGPMFLQCMAKKGAGILGGPGGEDGQGKGEIALTSPQKCPPKGRCGLPLFPG